MIINIRGTNGSGKSTIVRDIMKLYEKQIIIAYPPVYGKRGKRPMGYISIKGEQRLFVPGHYEIDNGGIDTLPDLELAYKLILKHHEWGANVLYEGKNLTDNIQRLIKMHESGLDTRVIFLLHPLEDCIASVRKRGHNIKEDTIKHIYMKCKKELVTLQAAGVNCKCLSRRGAFLEIKEWLREYIHVDSARPERLSSIERNNGVS